VVINRDTVPKPSVGSPKIVGMATERAVQLIEDYWGKPDAGTQRWLEVFHASTAALLWVKQATGSAPAPAVADQVEVVAERLRSGADDGDPSAVLMQAAKAALARQGTGAA
jgi:hypothetical protein